MRLAECLFQFLQLLFGEDGPVASLPFTRRRRHGRGGRCCRCRRRRRRMGRLDGRKGRPRWIERIEESGAVRMMEDTSDASAVEQRCAVVIDWHVIGHHTFINQSINHQLTAGCCLFCRWIYLDSCRRMRGKWMLDRPLTASE